MAQGSILPSGQQSAAGYTQAVRDALSYVATFFLGASAPAASGQPFGGQHWGDTTAGYWKRRNVANTAWVVEGVLDGFMANGLCRGLRIEVLNSATNLCSVSVGDITVEGTYLPPLANGTINTATVGNVGGLDTGSWAANTWYAVFAICNHDGAGRGYLASTSATAPTMPSGYTRKRRIGWIRTTGTPTVLHKMRQIGNRVWWHRNTNDTDVRVVDTGSAVGTLSTTFASVTLTNAVPPGVERAYCQGRLRGNSSLAAEVELIVQPTGAGMTAPNAIHVTHVAGTASACARQAFEIDLNASRQFDWAVSSTTNISDCDIDVLGWEDRVV